MKKCESVGTYRPEFLPVINTLADILEERDNVRAQYRKEGSRPVITKISDRGAVNSGKNPLLTAWEDLNKDALAYWKELGLTPAGLKKLSYDALHDQNSGLEQLLEGLTDG